MNLFSIRSLTALAVLSAPMAAQGMLPYLPKKTMMAMSAPDLAKSMAEFQQMPMAKMWAEDEVQAFIGDVMEMAMEGLDQGMGEMRDMHDAGMLPISPDTLMQLRLQGFTLAITDVEMDMGDFGPMPKIGTLVHLDFGESAATWMPLVQMGMGMLQQEAGDEMTMTEWSIGDVKAVTMAPNNAPPGFEMSMNVAMVPNGIVLGTLTEDVKDVVTNWVNKTPVLSQTAGYAAAAKQIDTQDATLHMFMAPESVVGTGMGLMQMFSEMGGAIPTEGGMIDMPMLDFDGVQRAMKAMGNGAIPITSRFPASGLVETTGAFDLGPMPLRPGRAFVDDAEMVTRWAEAVIDAAHRDARGELHDKRAAMVRWAREEYSWSAVASQWSSLFQGQRRV